MTEGTEDVWHHPVRRMVAYAAHAPATLRRYAATALQLRAVRVLGRTVAKAWSDRILGLSAEAAFWQLLSVPPLLLALLGSLGYVSNLLGTQTIAAAQSSLVDIAGRAFSPDVVHQLLEPMIQDVLRRGRPEFISIGFLLSLWAGSSAMATFVNTITIAYDQRDERGAVRSRLLALGLYLVFIALAVVTLPLLVLSPKVVVDLVPDDWAAFIQALLTAAYWPVVVALLLVALTSLYHVVLPHRPPWRQHLPGAVFALAILVPGSWLMRSYVAWVFGRAASYGALAAPIAALLFFFLVGLSVLLGAELNAVLAVRRRESAGQEPPPPGSDS